MPEVEQAVPPPVAAEEAPKVRKPNGHDIVYGIPWPKGKSKLLLELACYRTNRKQAEGGLGAYRHFKNAWQIVWPRYEWNDWTKLMVEAWCGYSRISIMGHAAAGKTFTLAHIALLDWMADPMQTMTSLATVTAEGLRLRMWGDLMRAYESVPIEIRRAFKNYSTSNRMQVMVDMDDGSHELDKYIIEGMAVSRDKNSMGKIRGKHAPRRRVIFDEADDMPAAAYDAMGNIMTDPDVKIVDMSNATDRLSNFGKACEPKHGWSSIHDTDLFWETKAGGICIHLDGLQNPNMKPGAKQAEYMLNALRIEKIRETYGENSKEWWCMVRGFFPPDGMVSRIWPMSVIENAKAGIVWDFAPVACATLDPAFEYDDCVLHRGEKGRLRDGRKAISGVSSHKIQTKEGPGLPPKDYQVAREVKRLCEEWGVHPRDFIMDKTGGGRGVFAILQQEWSMDVQGINYGGEATERPMQVGETDKANQIVKYFVSELWFRARYLAQAGCLMGLGKLNPLTIDDLTSRLYVSRQYTSGSLMQAETKAELKKRLGRSPDYGDAFVQFGELLARNLHEVAPLNDGKPRAGMWGRQREIARKASRIYDENVVDVEVF